MKVLEEWRIDKRHSGLGWSIVYEPASGRSPIHYHEFPLDILFKRYFDIGCGCTQRLGIWNDALTRISLAGRLESFKGIVLLLKRKRPPGAGSLPHSKILCEICGHSDATKRKKDSCPRA